MLLNRPDRRALALNVGTAIAGALGVNALIFGLGWNLPSHSPGPRAAFAPPDWLIGAVWTVLLLPLAAAARWRMNAFTAQPGARRARGWATALLAACLTWPFYSLALGSRLGGLLGNLLTLAVAGKLMTRLWPYSRAAAWGIAPTFGWLLFATATVLRELGWI